jgi:hypothetical protein
MARRPPAAGRGSGGRLLAVALAVALALAACSTDGGATPPPAPASVAPLTSPAVGLLTGLDAEGLTRVTGFRLRTDDGAEVPFRLGILENGAEFPPGHLAEHMATTTKVRVFFRDEGGEHVVYRLEDAE